MKKTRQCGALAVWSRSCVFVLARLLSFLGADQEKK